MRLPMLAALGGAGATATSDRAVAKTAGRARSRTARWRRAVALATAVLAVLAGCGGSPRPTAGSRPAFPGTPAGAQARWFVQALGRLPIPDAAIHAHFAPAFLAKLPPAAINARLAGTGQLRLLSVTPKGPNLVVFVMSVRGAQRFRVELPVDTHGRITNLQAQELAPTASPASVLPALAKLPAHTPVLLTCSNADGYFGCAEVNRLAAGLSNASARLDYVHLNGVDHVLKEDITKIPAAFGQPLPF